MENPGRFSDVVVDMRTTVAGCELDVPVWNASGVWCTSAAELRELALCPWAGAITSKSCTMKPRTGNPEPRYYAEADWSVNAMGLPNRGLSYYMAAASRLQDVRSVPADDRSHPIAVARGPPRPKPFFLSVCGLTHDESVAMVHDVNELGFAGVDGIELNLSCPNVPGKPQTAYDFEATDEVLRRVAECTDTIPLGVKLPPYLDLAHHDRIAEVLGAYKSVIRWVTAINSVGNCLALDVGDLCPFLRPKHGLGGFGGGPIKPIALANVWNLRQRLPSSIDVIGCGGVTCGRDVFEHLLAGATAVQVGTYLMENGPASLGNLLRELRVIMLMHGFERLADCRGQLTERSGQQQ